MSKGSKSRIGNQKIFNEGWNRIFNKSEDKMSKEYTSTITVKWSINNHVAVSEEQYRKKLKDQFHEQYGIILSEDEITDVEEIANE